MDQVRLRAEKVEISLKVVLRQAAVADAAQAVHVEPRTIHRGRGLRAEHWRALCRHHLTKRTRNQ